MTAEETPPVSLWWVRRGSREWRWLTYLRWLYLNYDPRLL